jgi:N6-L-threonylcarbamoyladenine synthase
VLTLAQRIGGSTTLDIQTKADIARAFQDAIVDVLVTKSLAALELTGRRQLVVAGGVGANRQLRTKLSQEAIQRGVEVFYPPLEFCTDNGAMIAFAGAMRLLLEQTSRKNQPTLSFTVKPRWDLERI